MTAYGPDNPREWDPNHRTLSTRHAPHETSGLVRMHRAGHSGQQIMKLMKIKARELTKHFGAEIDAEQAAHAQGRQIYDALIKRSRT
ncbi:hypothetical protein SEA_PHARAOH_67 [Mycobacterium phage Pharaoh]|uniref:Gp68-like predicted RNA polymerase component domain-containing protein n=1 Tax=Mycobacterium phage Pharaoh TaxID=2530140 RepID=A0A481W251_9CAUD|nr:hypothetical protein KIV59_gp23 [Mycobacterium phage Pharaoh]QBJ00255.1 hypothetical protein SEA_PHARAOH_67 [Mycobacterium phage Pharaoh]